MLHADGLFNVKATVRDAPNRLQKNIFRQFYESDKFPITNKKELRCRAREFMYVEDAKMYNSLHPTKSEFHCIF